jgi:hypothetical protein
MSNYVELENNTSNKDGIMTLIDLFVIECIKDRGLNPAREHFVKYHGNALSQLVSSDHVYLELRSDISPEDSAILHLGKYAIGYRVLRSLNQVKVFYNTNEVAKEIVRNTRINICGF